MDTITTLQQADAAVAALAAAEALRQQHELELIASENYCSPAVLAALATAFHHKYSEGYPGKRYYGGNDVVDELELLAISRAKQLFGAEHVNVQPLSGGPANIAALMALLQPGDTVLGMDLAHGGHLTHGHPLNYTGKTYRVLPYGVRADTGLLDMDALREQALRERPRLIIAGASAYPRSLDFAAFRNIADECGALLMVDMAHIAGLVAGGVHASPVPHADVVTTTTHKTLRGPRGAMILCREAHAAAIDRAVFPGVQGGPHDHVTAAKAVALGEALQPSFATYARDVVDAAQALAAALAGYGWRIITGGTDTHLLLLDVWGNGELVGLGGYRGGTTGKEAEARLHAVGLSANKNMIPHDTRRPLDPSGLRLGTAAAVTRGLRAQHMPALARIIHDALLQARPAEQLRAEVREMLAPYPLP